MWPKEVVTHEVVTHEVIVLARISTVEEVLATTEIETENEVAMEVIEVATEVIEVIEVATEVVEDTIPPHVVMALPAISTRVERPAVITTFTSALAAKALAAKDLADSVVAVEDSAEAEGEVEDPVEATKTI